MSIHQSLRSFHFWAIPVSCGLQVASLVQVATARVPKLAQAALDSDMVKTGYNVVHYIPIVKTLTVINPTYAGVRVIQHPQHPLLRRFNGFIQTCGPQLD
jgi:hypothetical protein